MLSIQALTWDRFGLGPLHRLVRLTSLKFEEGALGCCKFAALAPSLGLLTDLKSLELPDVDTEPDTESDVSSLSASLAGLVSLESLILGRIGLSTADAKMMLSNLTSLRHLELGCHNVTSDIAPALAALKALTHLDFMYNHLGESDEGMAATSASLCLLTDLVFLDLEGNISDVTVAAAAALGHSLPQSLTHLSMAENNLGAGGIVAFSPGLQRLTALRTLDLSGNISYEESARVISDSVRALAACLERMPGLTSLHLCGNCLGPDCVPTLAGGVNLQQLKELNLSFNQLDVSGALLLAALSFNACPCFKGSSCAATVSATMGFLHSREAWWICSPWPISTYIAMSLLGLPSRPSQQPSVRQGGQ